MTARNSNRPDAEADRDETQPGDESDKTDSVSWGSAHDENRWYADDEDSGWAGADSERPASAEAQEAAAQPEPAPEPTPEPEPDEPEGEPRRRSKTIARKQMMRERRRMLAQGTLPEIVEYDRPGMRSECRDAKRPCLYVSCRYHLYLDVNPVTGSIKLNFPDKKPWELAETCALDVAERGGITLEEVGEIMNLTRERIRQVEVTGLEKLRDGEFPLQTFVDGRELDFQPPSDDPEE